MEAKPPTSLPLELVLGPERDNSHTRHTHYRLRSQLPASFTPPPVNPVARLISPPLSVYSSAWDTRIDEGMTQSGLIVPIFQPFEFPPTPTSLHDSSPLPKMVP
jgi:hypothetical protein